MMIAVGISFIINKEKSGKKQPTTQKYKLWAPELAMFDGDTYFYYLESLCNGFSRIIEARSS